MNRTTCSCSGCSRPLPSYLTTTGPLGNFPGLSIPTPRSPQARTADAIDDLREQMAELTSVMEHISRNLETNR